MPVVLGSPQTGSNQYFAEIDVTPTPAGLAHAAVQLDADPQDVASRWDSLPPVTIVNQLTEVRPGATTLLQGTVADGGPNQVVLAFQRYGRGKALALTAQDTWLWQMHADVPLEDQSHEMFWSQLLRWLVDGVPDAVQVQADLEQVEPGETVRLVGSVSDSTYIEVNDATVRARLTSPTGVVEEVPMEWTVETDGEYVAEFQPAEMGDYEIELVAERAGDTIGAHLAYVHAAPSDDEYFGAARRTDVLRRIADETGGRFYTPETSATLPEDISVTGAGVTLVEENDLWDMPFLFLVMLLLMGAEWGYRRIRGLV
jgi:hypothetical protein